MGMPWRINSTWMIKGGSKIRYQWLTLVILATWEAEIGRIII
jgi:hypothetical protein